MLDSVPVASEFPSLKFRRTWRPYQERVLDMADLHLSDRRLHVVAAPGSGKTTLGIELFRRLGKAALVLSPTRTIRDQWIERLREFLPEDAPWPQPWVSQRIDDLRIFTSITYQALHASARADDETKETIESEVGEGDTLGALDAHEIEDIANRLRAAGVTTLILDEAHHLRAEWWKALTELVSRIEGMQIIALTATPPYDSQSKEWHRYEELCGTIDEEISVPELVKAGTLCAHQDFLWTVVPTEKEKQYVAEHVAHVEALVAKLMASEPFAQDLLAHPWVAAESPDIEAIQDEPELAIALLVFVKAKGLAVPVALSAALDLTLEDVPAITTYWWERLLTLYLFGQFNAQDLQLKARRNELARELRDWQLLQKRQLQLVNPRLVNRFMTQSAAKIAACAEINALERSVRGTSLRQVILTDYIRDEGVLEEGGRAPEALGAWPVFRHLVLTLPEHDREACALLTGRLVIVSASVYETVRSHCDGAQELPQFRGHVRLINPKPDIVSALTRALEDGRVRTLVGTRALLGEGWDAPCINSLILASSVGAFVLTNQMRGRAIRVDRAAPQKVASIWHVVAVVLDRRNPFLVGGQQPIFWPGTADLRDLMHRFRTFVGLDVGNQRIENNLERLDLPYLKRRRDFVTGADQVEFVTSQLTDAAALLANNDRMAQRLRDLESVQRGWRAAIATATQGRVVPTVKTGTPPHAALFSLANTWAYFLLAALGIFVTVLVIVVNATRSLLVASVLAFLFAVPKVARASWLAIRHLPIDGTLHQIGIAVRNTLCATRIIEDSPQRLPVISNSEQGVAYVNLGGGSFRDQSVFADCMREIVSPIENPRYLIVREARWLGFKRLDYHAVPACLAVKKENAELFLKAWIRHVGPATLVYTRSPENRKLLLRARVRAFSAGATDAARAAERTDRWM